MTRFFQSLGLLRTNRERTRDFSASAAPVEERRPRRLRPHLCRPGGDALRQWSALAPRERGAGLEVRPPLGGAGIRSVGRRAQSIGRVHWFHWPPAPARLADRRAQD